jgi:hypothetical protein
VIRVRPMPRGLARLPTVMKESGGQPKMGTGWPNSQPFLKTLVG